MNDFTSEQDHTQVTKYSLTVKIRQNGNEQITCDHNVKKISFVNNCVKVSQLGQKNFSTFVVWEDIRSQTKVTNHGRQILISNEAKQFFNWWHRQNWIFFLFFYSCTSIDPDAFICMRPKVMCTPYTGYRNTHDLEKFGWNWFCDHRTATNEKHMPKLCTRLSLINTWS